MPPAAKKIASGGLWWKWLLFVFGILLIISGIYLLFSPVEALVTSVILVGLCLLFGGASNIVAYFASRGIFGVSGWILAEGIISVFLSLLLLRNISLGATVLLFLVGVWFLIAGLIRIVNAVNMARLKFAHWGVTLFFGLLLLILGAVSFYMPIVNMIAIGIFIGIYFIVCGLVNLVEFSIVDRLDYRRNKVLAQLLK
jgi:uncharacterized membrane protein HdeD (DUF308 family)